MYTTAGTTGAPRVPFRASRLRLALGCQALRDIPRQGVGSAPLAPIPQGMWPVEPGGTETSACHSYTRLNPLPTHSLAPQTCLHGATPCRGEAAPWSCYASFKDLLFLSVLTRRQLWKHEGNAPTGRKCPPAVLWTYAGISCLAEEMPTSSSTYDYQWVQFYCFFMLMNFPKLYKCLIYVSFEGKFSSKFSA